MLTPFQVMVRFIINVFVSRPVGWRVSTSPRSDLVLDAQSLLVHNSDRGVQPEFNGSP